MKAYYDHYGTTSTTNASVLDNPSYKSYMASDGTKDKYGYIDAVVSKMEGLGKPEADYKAKFIRDLINSLYKDMGKSPGDTRVGIFCKHKSDVDNDLKHGLLLDYYYHRVYPIESDPQNYDKIYLFSYDICIIVGVLEYLPSKMARANVIKEALTALINNYPRRLAIIAKSEEDVEKSKETEPDIITGFNVRELESLALFAGAKEIAESSFTKSEDFKDLYIVATNC